MHSKHQILRYNKEQDKLSQSSRNIHSSGEKDNTQICKQIYKILPGSAMKKK